MYDRWRQRMEESPIPVPEAVEKCANHTTYMVCTKLSRAAHNTLHVDDWRDIMGFAKCMIDCLEEHEARTKPPFLPPPQKA
jgi:hypothetical protein